MIISCVGTQQLLPNIATRRQEWAQWALTWNCVHTKFDSVLGKVFPHLLRATRPLVVQCRVTDTPPAARQRSLKGGWVGMGTMMWNDDRKEEKPADKKYQQK